MANLKVEITLSHTVQVAYMLEAAAVRARVWQEAKSEKVSR